jgi:hypothetical protein
MAAILPSTVRSAFVQAGWHEERRVAVPVREFCGTPIFTLASELLTEFCGLHVWPSTTAGIECATGDIQFDPNLVLGEHDSAQINTWCSQVVGRLFPLGAAQKGYLLLFVDEYGRVFETDIVAGSFCLVGESFSEAMETILLGKMLHPVPLRIDSQRQIS